MSINRDILLEIRKTKSQEINLSEKIDKEIDTNLALIYPSPYHIAMSSLGYQTIYRLFNNIEGVNCERFFFTRKY